MENRRKKSSHDLVSSGIFSISITKNIRIISSDAKPTEVSGIGLKKEKMGKKKGTTPCRQDDVFWTPPHTPPCGYDYRNKIVAVTPTRNEFSIFLKFMLKKLEIALKM